MQFVNVKRLIKPLLKAGKEWQNISINGEEIKPRFYFSDIQWLILILSSLVLVRLHNGISRELAGYIISAFSISVSLFMSLLVSIFDKFENTVFTRDKKSEEEINRLKQKKNFFKRFITITSYLVVLSVFIIILCSLSYIFNLPDWKIDTKTFCLTFSKLDLMLTLKNSCVILYRITLNYFLLDYLLLTFFIAGSAYEYYVSEVDRKKIE